jgi:predicted nucleotidyltransferase
MATARELGAAGWQAYLGPAHDAPPGGGIAAEERKRLLARVREAAGHLKRLGACQVVLFGSLAHGGWFSPMSDVDLAVLGLPPASFWEGWRLVEDVLGDRSVDLVVMEQASESLLKAIERDGVEL